MPSAEQHLKDAWKHVDHEHVAHESKQVISIDNHAVDERSGQRRPHDPVFVVRCSCGDNVRIPVQDVYEHTAPAEESPAPATASTK